MGEGKYDKYCISGPQPGNPPSSGALIAWVNDEIFKGSNQYHVHWVFRVSQECTRYEDLGRYGTRPA